VVVYGSSLSELTTPQSDIDLSLVLPEMQQRTEMLEEQLRGAQAQYAKLASEVSGGSGSTSSSSSSSSSRRRRRRRRSCMTGIVISAAFYHQPS